MIKPSVTTGENTNYTIKTEFLQQGWQCPACKKILAPWMPNCNCHETITITYGKQVVSRENRKL